MAFDSSKINSDRLLSDCRHVLNNRISLSTVSNINVACLTIPHMVYKKHVAFFYISFDRNRGITENLKM